MVNLDELRAATDELRAATDRLSETVVWLSTLWRVREQILKDRLERAEELLAELERTLPRLLVVQG